MAMISPEAWLTEVANSRRAAVVPLQGVARSGVLVGWGSVAAVGWLAMVCGLVLLLVEGLDLVSGALALALGVFAWLCGWPFVVVVTSRGVLSRRGLINTELVVAAGWASTGEPLIPRTESYVPVLIIKGGSGDLVWRPLAEIRKGAWSSTERGRQRLLEILVGPRVVDMVPLPEEAAPSLSWPWGM